MPICGSDDRLKGMLTDRDVLTKGFALGRDLDQTRVTSSQKGSQ